MPAAEQTSADARRKAAREVIDILHEIATLLNTHLDRQQLSYCVSLIENGANPEALAKVILQLREEYPTSSVDGDTEAAASSRDWVAEEQADAAREKVRKGGKGLGETNIEVIISRKNVISWSSHLERLLYLPNTQKPGILVPANLWADLACISGQQKEQGNRERLILGGAEDGGVVKW
ncbi:hypothetical protein GGP41_001119 [Bipolaris sorokiniana]|uniref:Mitotic-spindle organizing protein 1 n=1 Tax=Cochliobolus sativus TaxID=45130 RepID=A0A8H5ZBL0_COCSA|nr:hypothetical protein GGP41_001119 [Bipolaris sorokiniana]